MQDSTTDFQESELHEALTEISFFQYVILLEEGQFFVFCQPAIRFSRNDNAIDTLKEAKKFYPHYVFFAKNGDVKAKGNGAVALDTAQRQAES